MIGTTLWVPGAGSSSPGLLCWSLLSHLTIPWGQYVVSKCLYATGEEWRDSSRKNDVSGGESKARCCKEQHCTGTWVVWSINQGKLDMVKQEMARVSIDILRISELKWMGMGEFNSGDHFIFYREQESLRRNGVALRVNKIVQNAVLVCDLKNDRMISVHFHWGRRGHSFIIICLPCHPHLPPPPLLGGLCACRILPLGAGRSGANRNLARAFPSLAVDGQQGAEVI